ncbi:MAG: hypothetical protein M1820_006979 [Bogoriella megaspora]|nr:MAG: hypothetical protein M1820_006979 [Bogoriella megaspora]
MPYDTRRKSLSLPSLGIHVPKASSKNSPPTSTTPASEQPPSKKPKRSHKSSFSSTSPQAMSPPPKPTVGRPRSAGRPMEHTPPPSPGATGTTKIDTQGINDDIVVAVIEQLEMTANRPHLVKELAAILANDIPAVTSSSNPSAIVSSRLTNYMRRNWTALAPCPMGRELVGTHPKRTYFFLTNTPHQPIPEPSATNALPANTQARIISPSLSSGSNNNVSKDESMSDDAASDSSRRERAALSPSPEVDFSCPELDGDDATPPLTPGGTFSGRNSVSSQSHRSSGAGNTAHKPPPLEREEREFTETAAEVRRRRRSEASAARSAGSSSTASIASKSASASVSGSASPPPHTDDFDIGYQNSQDTERPTYGNDVDMDILTHESKLVVLDQDPLWQASDDGLHEALSRGETIGAVDLVPANGKKRKLEPSAMEIDVEAMGIVSSFGDPNNQETWYWNSLENPENVDLEELDAMFGEC